MDFVSEGCLPINKLQVRLTRMIKLWTSKKSNNNFLQDENSKTHAIQPAGRQVRHR